MPMALLDMPVRRLGGLAVLFTLTLPSVAVAASQGELVQSDNLGMNVYSHDFSTHTTKTVADAQNLSEFIGLHYYFIDRVRVGMNLQCTERLAPAPASGRGRVQTLALLPQIGWNFLDPFFTALTFTIAPRTGGETRLDLGLQWVLGAGFAVSRRVHANLAIEVPWNFHVHQTLGLTPLAGISVRL